MKTRRRFSAGSRPKIARCYAQADTTNKGGINNVGVLDVVDGGLKLIECAGAVTDDEGVVIKEFLAWPKVDPTEEVILDQVLPAAQGTEPSTQFTS